VLGADGKLWREYGIYDNPRHARVNVDTNARSFQVLAGDVSYVLGTDGKLWREFGTYDNPQRTRVQVDGNVAP
jgi:hypothetical protein